MSLQSFSLSQQQIFYDQSAWPGSCHLNVGGTGNIRGNLNQATFLEALENLIAQHPVLRTSIAPDGQQTIHTRWHVPLIEYADLSRHLAPLAQCERLVQEAFASTFEFSNEQRPWQMLMMKIADNHHIIMARFHHVIMDGYSVALAFRQLGEEYQRIFNGNNCDNYAAAVDGSATFAAFIAASEAYQQSKSWQKDALWWQAEIADVQPPMLLREQHSGKDATSGNQLSDAYHHFYFVARSQYAQYETFASAQGLTPYHLYGAALVSYLSGIWQTDEIIIGVPILNRSGKRFKHTLGMFAVLLPLKITITPDMSAIELMLHFAQKLKEVYRHAKYPLSDIIKHPSQHKTDDLVTNRLFDVILSYELHDFSVSFGDADLQRIQRCFSPLARYPLTICICEFHQNEPIEIAIESSLSHFSKQETQRLGERLQQVVGEIQRNPQGVLSRLPLVTSVEHTELTHIRHTNITRQPETMTALQHIHHQSCLVPNNVAIKTTNGAVTYGALWLQVEQAARRLVDQGIGKGDVVAVVCERTIDTIVLYLAINRIGAVYVPMDPCLPANRRDGMLQDCNARLVFYDATPDASCDEKRPVISVSEWQAELASKHSNDTPLPVWPDATDAMYILFTSGSMGAPKGVVVPHGALATRIAWLARTFAITPADITLQSIPLSFDPAQLEIYLPLTQGACCALAAPGKVAPDNLLPIIKHFSVTTIIFVPTSLRYFMATLPANNDAESCQLTLRIAISGGEQLPTALAQQFVQRTGARLFNLYGPTEACIFASAYEYQSSAKTGSVPIGRPVDNTQLFVLDRHKRLLPDGTIGELYIGGHGLAHGYLHDAQTQQHFLHQLLPHSGTLYKTGDLVFWDTDKQLQFVGRSDNQIKLRGIRIEPAEIETVMEQLPFVAMAAVKTCDARLVAWFVEQKKIAAGNKHQQSQSQMQQLRAHLQDKLPAHLIPEQFIAVNTIPVMVSGKTDYGQLQTDAGRPLVAMPGVNAPQDTLQAWLLETWTNILPQAPQGIDVTFNQAGGDSLQALNLLATIAQEKGVQISLVTFLRHDTIRKLALQIRHQESALCQNLSGHNAGVRIYLAASGHGDAMRFQRLADALQHRAHVVMLQPPLDESLETLQDNRDLAQRYCDIIKQEYFQGKWLLAGFSVAGVTALETALLCQEQGIKVANLSLIDTTFPGWLVRKTPIWQVAGKLTTLLKLQQLNVNQRTLGTLFSDKGLMFQVRSLRRFKVPQCQLNCTLIVSSAFQRWHRWLFRPWYGVFTGTITEQQMEGYHGTLFEAKQVETMAELLIQDLV